MISQMGQACNNQKHLISFAPKVLEEGIVHFLKKWLRVWKSEPAVKTVTFPVLGPCPLSVRRGRITI